jgi:hypothetical protein
MIGWPQARRVTGLFGRLVDGNREEGTFSILTK